MGGLGLQGVTQDVEVAVEGVGDGERARLAFQLRFR